MAASGKNGKGKDRLIQTRIPQKLFDWVEADSKRTGLSVAAWMRVRIFQLREAAAERELQRKG